MAFSRPTLSELIGQTQGELVARFPGADTTLRRSVLGVFARSWAGALFGLYGFLDWISAQILPDTAEAELLDRHAANWGLSRGAPAAAGGDILVTGVDGAVIPAGSVLQKGAIDYATLAEATIAGGVATIEVEALDPGAAGNLATNVKLAFVSPVSGVTSVARAAAPGFTGGVNEESDSSLRARLLERMRRQPQGGAEADYLAWTRAFSAEITRAWVRPAWSGLGSVGVTFVFDGRPDIIPTGPDVAALQAHLDALRPVTAQVVVFAPTPKPMALTIHLAPDTAEIRAAVVDQLKALLAREAAPGGSILLSHIREAVSAAAGEVDSVVSVPAADFTTLPSEIATLGAITWI
jgi:uncharacterized phage protein gp47/JayE